MSAVACQADVPMESHLIVREFPDRCNSTTYLPSHSNRSADAAALAAATVPRFSCLQCRKLLLLAVLVS